MMPMVTAMVGEVEATLPDDFDIGRATMKRATGETEAEYYAAAAMYRRLFMQALSEARRRNWEWPTA